MLEYLFASFVLGLLANAATQQITGRSIPEHLLGWWNALYAEIQAWLGAHEHLGVTRVVARVVRIVDSTVIAAARAIRVTFSAETPEGNRHQIRSRTLSPQEIAAAFPGFTTQTELEVEI